jgi:predicted TIM-barrel fold metal-dependent hydrolase
MPDDYRSNKTAEAYDGALRGIPLPFQRTPQKQHIKLPAGTTVVSVDNHWSQRGDVFYESFPQHLKERAPRLTFNEDGHPVWLVEGKTQMTPGIIKSQGSYECMPGCWSLEERMRDLDVEGIQKEIAFPNDIPQFYGHPDLEVRAEIFRIQNEYMAATQKASGGRFYGTGLIKFWDMDNVYQSVREVKDMGLRTVIIPQFPQHSNKEPLNYCSPEMDPLWRALEDHDMPACFHVGEFFKDGPGGHGTTVMVSFGPYRKNFGEMIFGGTFDRFPKLQIIFAEAEMNWLPGALQTATMCFELYYDMIEPKIKHPPRHYWHNNMHCTFTHDPAGLRLLDLIGADRVMWSSDYPHVESTLGYSWDAMKCVLEAAKNDDEVRAILGGNAIKLFKL